MLDLKLDSSTGDLQFSNFDLDLVEGQEWLQQKLKIKLSMFYGEWWLDTTRGTPYYQYVYVKNPDMDAIASVIKAQILDIPEVSEIVSYSHSFSPSTRVYSAEFTANTVYGQVSASI